MSKKSWRVPFTKQAHSGWGIFPGQAAGSMLDWASEGDSAVEWRAPYEFEETLWLRGAGRGRSAVTFTLATVSGVTYAMKLSHFAEMVKATDIHHGRVEGAWGFAKQGTNYSIVFLREIRRSAP